MSEELKQLLEFLQREADHKRQISPTITQSELSMVLAHIRSLTLLHDAACNRSEYWKAEKLAADAEIDTLRAQLPDAQAVPADVIAALDRMCTPLDDSWLGSTSATAQADARCMKVIRDYVLGSAVKDSLTTDTTVPPAAQAVADDVVRNALQEMMNIVDDSRGVAGFHLNGDIAEWDSFPEVHAARAALLAAQQNREKGQ